MGECVFWEERGPLRTHILEETQHFIVSRVVGQEEGQVRVSKNGSDSNQTRTTTGNDGHILPSVQTVFALAVHLIVEICDSLSQGANTGSGSILSTSHGNVNGLGTLKASIDIILDLGGTLAQVGPLLGVLEVAKLGGTLGAPDDSGR